MRKVTRTAKATPKWWRWKRQALPAHHDDETPSSRRRTARARRCVGRSWLFICSRSLGPAARPRRAGRRRGPRRRPLHGAGARRGSLAASCIRARARVRSACSGAGSGERGGFRERHVSAALERRVADDAALEELFASSRKSAPDVITRQAGLARKRLEERVGGASQCSCPRRARRSISERELLGLVPPAGTREPLPRSHGRRPCAEPSNAELSALHRSRARRFSGAPFESVQPGEALVRLHEGSRRLCRTTTRTRARDSTS